MTYTFFFLFILFCSFLLLFFFLSLFSCCLNLVVVVVVACCFPSIKSCVFGAISKITSNSYCWVLNSDALSQTWTGGRPGGGLGGDSQWGFVMVPAQLRQIWRWEIFHLIRVFISRSYVKVLYIISNSFKKLRISFSFILDKFSKCIMSQDAIGWCRTASRGLGIRPSDALLVHLRQDVYK